MNKQAEKDAFFDFYKQNKEPEEERKFQERKKKMTECRYNKCERCGFSNECKIKSQLTEAKEIIREYLKATESWDYDFADILKCNKKAEAFLKG